MLLHRWLFLRQQGNPPETEKEKIKMDIMMTKHVHILVSGARPGPPRLLWPRLGSPY